MSVPNYSQSLTRSMPPSPGAGSPAGREGLSRFVKRLSSVLRRNGSKKASATGGTAPSAAGPAKASTSQSQPAAPSPPLLLMSDQGPQHAVMTYEWNALHHERARALFAKYGLTAELDQWMSHPNLQVKRVEKPIRMRVRRICHRCLIPFGSNSSCSNCEHVRCKKCPRYPPLVVDTKGKGKAVATIDVPLARAGTTQLKEKHKAPLLTIPSRRGGQDLIYRPPRQRIRRTCHRCGSLFKGGATECVTCKHIRCKLCPRDPAKLEKYPDGYPGDVDPPYEPPLRTFKRPRIRVRHYCHKCNTMYSHGNDVCSHCGQEKGDDTIRDPPKKVKQPPDPEVVRRVEERLAALVLRGQEVSS